MKSNYDVIVIGGGPAGSTAAAVLAMKGRRVLLLEKEKFPRYHIGESLIPYTYFTLERLGMLDKLRKTHFVRKYSVQFVRQSGEVSTPFYFTQNWDHPSSSTWQVIRSEFDQMLLDNTREKGAEVIEEMTVKEPIRENDFVVGVRGEDKQGRPFEVRAPLTIDASGRDGFTQVKNGWRIRDPKLNKIAVWTYYKGAMRDQGIDEGATTVAYLPGKGWFWYIPWPDDRVSVGVVAESSYLFRDTRDPETIFQREVGNNLWIQNHLAPGKVASQYRVTGEYSFRSKYCAANGLVLAGDAFAFLDPVFSSGVMLALRSGEMAGDAVDAALTAGDYSAKMFSSYGNTLCYGIESMRKLVYAFYDPNFRFKELFKKYPHLHKRLTDCLTGDLFTDFDELFQRVAEFADVPAPVEHGKPLINQPQGEPNALRV
ncbi:MAG: NAD(P)/FAD-dependent oxidoreductase [Methylacidiphilales bacterium]|nr:NAD(P)/FAD-dependent oxidoreductase [Candidatus Methylacidiphilales bacterium]